MLFLTTICYSQLPESQNSNDSFYLNGFPEKKDSIIKDTKDETVWLHKLFYPNGQLFQQWERVSPKTFNYTSISGENGTYFPNGQIALKVDRTMKPALTECWDSLGNQILNNGNGQYISWELLEGKPTIKSKGQVLNYKRIGRWLTYKNGKLIKESEDDLTIFHHPIGKVFQTKIERKDSTYFKYSYEPKLDDFKLLIRFKIFPGNTYLFFDGIESKKEKVSIKLKKDIFYSQIEKSKIVKTCFDNLPFYQTNNYLGCVQIFYNQNMKIIDKIYELGCKDLEFKKEVDTVISTLEFSELPLIKEDQTFKITLSIYSGLTPKN